MPGSTVVVSPTGQTGEITHWFPHLYGSLLPFAPELLPLWLIAVIASVVTILIMLVVLACVVAMCLRCRTNKSNKFKVQAPPASTLDVAENGR